MNPIRLLLVDDEEEFLSTLKKRLSRRGFAVFTAGGGQECLDILDREAMDVVVLDVKMPGKNGVETLGEIKRLKPGTAVVLLTGHADVDMAVVGIEAGAFDYLIKPVDIDDLVYAIEDAHKSVRLGSSS
ncbi:MAG: response regulator [Desulfovibrionaceae bacterium]